MLMVFLNDCFASKGRLMNKIMWWGYLHANNKIQVKRWLGDHRDYTDDCYDNPFVKYVVKPFEADNYEDAGKYIEQKVREHYERV